MPPKVDNLPTILLIHEAWHTPTLYSTLLDRLNTVGFTVACPQLSTCSIDPTNTARFADDVNQIYSIAFDLVGGGHDILVLMHGIYGGILGTEACGTLTKASRAAAGQNGGVVGLVYLAASVPQAGDSWSTIAGAQDFTPLLQNSDAGGLLNSPDKILFNDLGVNECQHWCDHMVRFSAKVADVYVDPSTQLAWQSCRSTYIVCGRDRLLPETAQRKMFKAAVGNGAVMDQEHLPHRGHSPIISAPGEVVRVVLAAAVKARPAAQ